MTDVDEDFWGYHGDHDDEANDFPEPNCFGCWDRGCRSCQPTRLQLLWWRITAPVRTRYRRVSNRSNDEAPF